MSRRKRGGEGIYVDRCLVCVGGEQRREWDGLYVYASVYVGTVRGWRSRVSRVSGVSGVAVWSVCAKRLADD